MIYTVGSLVRARGREWVVLPESADDPDVLVVRPLVGTEDETTGIYVPLEPVEPAHFGLPDPAADLGNHRSAALLRDAVRLGFRAGTGPFRSLGRIAVEPRPYQLVPLLMALRLDPVRLLIADDVGVGKTIEACLVLRELLDRGEITRSAVLCPPHLAEQWQRALVQKFHVDAELVLPGTAARLERQAGLGPAESLFERYPHVIVSTDYIKSERHQHDFLRACPEFVIVDEAHTCTSMGVGRAAQQRHQLLRGLLQDGTRHAVLVTATPHSGDEQAFRSLLALLDPGLAGLPLDLSGEANRPHREQLARYFVQRRRGDLRAYLGADTPFPERDLGEEHYALHPDYRRFIDDVIDYCRERVFDKSIDRRHQRVRWWSALALLRSIASSPAAASATLHSRSSTVDSDSAADVDAIGRRAVLDLTDETAEGTDVVPGSDDSDAADSTERARLLRFAARADTLAGAADRKLDKAIRLIDALIADGCAPIVFCRFIPTVEYVASALRKHFGARVEVAAVTGLLGHDEREDRIDALAEHPRRVLVCTDCLSEGIDLQHGFDAVMHYDLSWNPTRHEQREGRVDRYDQPKPRVRSLTFYGEDNPVDGIVLDVLLRKHKTIHKTLGITVPVPMDTNIIAEAIFEGLLLRERGGSSNLSFDFLEPQRREVDVQWDAAVERERRSRTVFAQHAIRVEEVASELQAARAAIGDDRVVEAFTLEALRTLGAVVGPRSPHDLRVAEVPAPLRESLDLPGDAARGLVFRPAPPPGGQVLVRTHPLVTAVADHVWKAALDPQLDGPARRAAVIRTRGVTRRTTLLLLRLRFGLVSPGRDGLDRPQLAEEVQLAGFRGSPETPEWLEPDGLEPLLALEPTENIPVDLASAQLGRILERFDAFRPWIDDFAARRAAELLEAHRRVRRAAHARVRALRVEPHLPVDVLGLYVYLPATGGAA